MLTDPKTSSSRRLSIVEIAIYITLWAVIFVFFPMDEPPVVMTFVCLLLPGALVTGPIGLFVWGRKAFFPAAIVGAVLWFLILLIPALFA